MPHPAGRTGDRNSTLPAPASLRLPDEEAIDWGDGTVWFVSWLDDHDAYHARRWYDPDEFDADDADAIARLRDCPGPEEGVFASLDVVEAAMGGPLPADCALDSNVRLPRTQVTTWAPAWAEDPLDHKGDLHCCGPAPDLDAAHRPHLTGR